MKKLLLASLPALLFFTTHAQIITTVAGSGIQGYTGDGGQATAAELYYPNSVGFDNTGNMYIADEGNEVIRKVNTLGVITTLAGNGTAGFYGDGGQATAAEISAPERVIGDKNGNIYIADLSNYRVRKISPAGVITTFAGKGSFSYSGDGGQATAAAISTPYGLAADTSGNIYISDQWNCRIRKVDITGIITTVAGNGTAGYGGDGGQATAASIKYPVGIAVDVLGNLYIADGGNARIRMVNTSGVISTIAGTGSAGFGGDGGQATAAQISNPYGVAVDASGNIFFDDLGNQRIRIISPSGVINTYAGTGTPGYNGDGIAATSAEINNPWDVDMDGAGNVYIADESNQRVRMVPGAPTGIPKPIDELSVNLYPNPNNGKFVLDIKGAEAMSKLEIYNISGQKVYSETVSYNRVITINMSAQPAGIYLYRIINRDGSNVANGKFVIE